MSVTLCSLNQSLHIMLYTNYASVLCKSESAKIVWLLNNFAWKKMVPRFIWYHQIQNFMENNISKILWNPLWGNFSIVVWNFELKYSNRAVIYFNIVVIHSTKTVMNSCNGKYRYDFNMLLFKTELLIAFKTERSSKTDTYLKIATNTDAQKIMNLLCCAVKCLTIGPIL